MTLRERQNMKTINRLKNDSKKNVFLGVPFRYIGQKVDDIWFDSNISNRGLCVCCSILNDNFVGIVSLTDIDSMDRSAEFNIMFDEVGSQNKSVWSLL